MFVLAAATAVLSLAGAVNGLNQALCGAHGLYLKSGTGQSPCDIAALLKGHGGTFNAAFVSDSLMALFPYRAPTYSSIATRFVFFSHYLTSVLNTDGVLNYSQTCDHALP